MSFSIVDCSPFSDFSSQDLSLRSLATEPFVTIQLQQQKLCKEIEMMNFEENESMEKLWQSSEVALPKVKKQAIFSAQLCSSSFVG